jgi:hypothetical protein
MMKSAWNALAALLTAGLVSGCTTEPDDPVTSRPYNLEGYNALKPNALKPNALKPNALKPNALKPNALKPNALAPEALASLQDPGENGYLARELTKYIVNCALDATQSFAFTWVDSIGVSHAESFPGGVGLATGWVTGPLDIAGQEWVTACVIARTNYAGRTVLISMRGPDPKLSLAAGEAESHQFQQAAFFGNMFGETLDLYVCTGRGGIGISGDDAMADFQSRMGPADGNPIKNVGNCFSSGYGSGNAVCPGEVVVSSLNSHATHCYTQAGVNTIVNSGGTPMPGPMAWSGPSYRRAITVYLDSTSEFYAPTGTISMPPSGSATP